MHDVPTGNPQSGLADAEGRFRLRRVPKEHVYLMLMGDAVLMTRVDPEPPLGDRDAARLEGVELVALRRARVQVRLAAGETADEVAFEDLAGEPVELRVHDGKPGPPALRQPIRGDQSDVLSVPETAAVLLHLRGGEVVRRRSVHLDPARLNEL